MKETDDIYPTNLITIDIDSSEDPTDSNKPTDFTSITQTDSIKPKKSKNPTDSLKIKKYLYDKDYENKVCVECKSPMPTFASINNGILICAQCAEKLKYLGYNISFIRDLEDEFDQYLLSFLERGGNSRYIRLSKQYDLDDMSLEEKLQTKILEYYRLLVSINYIIFKKLDKIRNYDGGTSDGNSQRKR